MIWIFSGIAQSHYSEGELFPKGVIVLLKQNNLIIGHFNCKKQEDIQNHHKLLTNQQRTRCVPGWVSVNEVLLFLPLLQPKCLF